MEESHSSSIPVFLMSFQVHYHYCVFCIFLGCTSDQEMIPQDPQVPLPETGERLKQGNPSGFTCRLQSDKNDKQPGLPQPSGTVWCSGCSNSCCNLVISGRMCLLRVTLLIPAAEDRDQQGSRWGGKRSGLWDGSDTAMAALVHPTLLSGATWCSGKCFSFFPIIKTNVYKSCGFNPWGDLWVV